MNRKLAIALAQKNPVCKLQKFCAVLYVNNKTYYGFNKYEVHPLQVKYGRNPQSIHLHAEIDAIVNALSNGETPLTLKGASMFVARVFRSGRPALAKPCPGCWVALAAFGINDVEWTQ